MSEEIIITCPYVTPKMKCYFEAAECKDPCPILVVIKRMKKKMRNHEIT